ncbi:zinc ribbon domain-containing protein [Sulfuricurvum sp.]|uniref:zinc ribbon domain-containing protein n=1 Tax=Sulfuricurvum sp. TaxID=2025608 RepID=UPI003C5097BC
MAIKKCKECKKLVSDSVDVCPYCGAQLKSKTLFLILFGTALIVVYGMSVYMNIGQ